MRSEDALLEACRLAPDDDAPRLVWADAVGGEHGELVVIQCNLARGDLTPTQTGALLRRERDLLLRRGKEWAGFGKLPVQSFEFRRGFVEAIQLDARSFMANSDKIFRCAPLLRSLTVESLVGESERSPPAEDPLEMLRALLESPAFSRLNAFHLLDIGTLLPMTPYMPWEAGGGVGNQWFHGRGDEAARLLAESGALARLDGFGISSAGFTDAGVHHLVIWGELGLLDRLWLCHNDPSAISDYDAVWRPPLGGDAVLTALAHALRVRSLNLEGVEDIETFVSALPPVTELYLQELTNETLTIMGRSRAAPTIETLRFGRPSPAHVDGFRAFPRLRALTLRGPRGDTERFAGDLAAALPSLRRLRFTADSQTARLVGRALGSQLEELVVYAPDRAYDRGFIDELQSYVAGVVVCGYSSPERQPLL